jgi:hypothetical protein
VVSGSFWTKERLQVEFFCVKCGTNQQLNVTHLSQERTKQMFILSRRAFERLELVHIICIIADRFDASLTIRPRFQNFLLETSGGSSAEWLQAFFNIHEIPYEHNWHNH